MPYLGVFDGPFLGDVQPFGLEDAHGACGLGAKAAGRVGAKLGERRVLGALVFHPRARGLERAGVAVREASKVRDLAGVAKRDVAVAGAAPSVVVVGILVSQQGLAGELSAVGEGHAGAEAARAGVCPRGARRTGASHEVGGI